ncbi:MAG: LysR family transcriptional regulator [Stappiaceae bacterium]
MNIDDIRAFVTVVESGSLAHAAVRLNLTQPAVTRRIQRLEQDLSVQLLDRMSKPARPTSKGQEAYRACLKVIQSTEHLKDGMTGKNNRIRLRVGMSYGLIDALTLPVFQFFNAWTEAPALELEAGTSLNFRAQLGQDRLDAAIVFLREEKTPDPKENGILLGREQVCFVAPVSFALEAPANLETLAEYPFILNPEGCGYRNGLEHRLFRAGLDMKVAASMYGIPQQLDLIANGAGIGLIPQRLVEISPHAEALQIVDVPEFKAALAIWLLHGSHMDPNEKSIEILTRAGQSVYDPTI